MKDGAKDIIVISYSWEVEVVGEEAFVIERCVSSPLMPAIKIGPMPRDFAGPLIDERKEFYDDLVQRYLRTQV